MSTVAVMQRPHTDAPDLLPLALSLAAGVHLAIAALVPERPPAPTRAAPPLEVELAPPKRDEPEPPPPTPAPTEPAPVARTPRAVATAARAAAGRLLTAPPSTTPNDAPLDFVTDPNGAAYGFGVVSRGGTATGEGVHGTDPVARPAVAARAAEEPLANTADLAEKPHLLAENPCRGFFPEGASADTASAVVRVVVDADGRARSVALVSESPPGDGFGAAATRCIREQRFSSARDHSGRAVGTTTTIRVRFER